MIYPLFQSSFWKVVKKFSHPLNLENYIFKNVHLFRGGGSGCAGCAIAHPIFSQMTIFISFLEKKKFENRTRFDRFIDKCIYLTCFLLKPCNFYSTISKFFQKYVHCAPNFKQLPPPLIDLRVSAETVDIINFSNSLKKWMMNFGFCCHE